jgi:hypothetical protein
MRLHRREQVLQPLGDDALARAVATGHLRVTP